MERIFIHLHSFKTPLLPSDVYLIPDTIMIIFILKHFYFLKSGMGFRNSRPHAVHNLLERIPRISSFHPFFLFGHGCGTDRHKKATQRQTCLRGNLEKTNLQSGKLSRASVGLQLPQPPTDTTGSKPPGAGLQRKLRIHYRVMLKAATTILFSACLL